MDAKFATVERWLRMSLPLLPYSCSIPFADALSRFLSPRVLHNALLLSDSSLHLFLQSHLNSEDIEACVSGQTKYTVEEAIHKFALMNRRFPEEDEDGEQENNIDYGSERYFLAFPPNTYVFIEHVAHTCLCRGHLHTLASFCWCHPKIMKKLIDWDFIELWQLIIVVFTHTSTLN